MCVAILQCASKKYHLNRMRNVQLVYWTIVADDAPLHTQQRERFEYFGLILVFRFCLLLCVFYFVFQQMLHQLLMLIQKAMHMRIMYKTRAEN